MRLKTLLVCLTTVEHAEDLMKQAVPLARRNDAHLIGLHTVEALMVYPGIAMHIPDAAFAAFGESQKKETESIKKVFRRHTENETFQSEFRLVRAESLSAGDRMVESARAADLVIMAQEDRDAERGDQRNAQVQVIRESGRPVLIVPNGYDGPTVGSNIVLGWSDAREAARAGHDMLVVADEGASVTILRVGSARQDALRDSESIDFAETLSRHGLKASLENRARDGARIAEVLCKAAFEKGADLIVTGALGHSRAYDFVVGATTHALLESATVPVLFSK